MIDMRGVDRLLTYHDPHNALLSVYVTVPVEAAGQREMWGRLHGLLNSVDADAGGVGRRAMSAEVDAVRESMTEHVRDWRGHGVAFLSSSALGVHEAVPVGWPVPDRVVVGPHPYVRPLLAALDHSRPYVVAVVDRRHAWLFRIEGRTVEPAGELVGNGVRDPSYAGWAGLEEYGVRQRATELVRRHYRTTATALAALLDSGETELVVGGHEVSIVEFVGILPEQVRRRITGTFVVDPHTMTAGEVWQRSGQAQAEGRADHEREVRAELADKEAVGLAVSGIAACAKAVSRSLADLLVVGGDGEVPGFVCDRCGELMPDDATCPGCDVPARPVPDLIDEMVAAVVRFGGKLEFVTADRRDGPWVGARLRGRLVPQGERGA